MTYQHPKPIATGVESDERETEDRETGTTMITTDSRTRARWAMMKKTTKVQCAKWWKEDAGGAEDLLSTFRVTEPRQT